MLEQTRQYLAAIPNLGALMDQVVVEQGINLNNFEELRTAREAARETVFSRLREGAALYHVIHYPEIVENDPLTEKPVKGGYVEITNVITGKAILIPMFVWHRFVEHGQITQTETLINLGNSKVSERPMALDFPGLFGILKGAPMPAEVVQEIQAQGQQVMATLQQFMAAK
jgi:hypothetical protein